MEPPPEALPWSDSDLIAISALEHWSYCPRQCALIHVERLWTENVHTAEGRQLHARTDLYTGEKRRGVRVATALPLSSEALGITGVADVVEFHESERGARTPYPVEYKRGRPKPHRADEVQLCAQAMCLEEMLGVTVPEGALFYGKTRRRREVLFDEALRGLTRDTIAAVRKMLSARITPAASYESKRCDACSLLDLCRPQLLPAGRAVDEWLRRQLAKD